MAALSEIVGVAKEAAENVLQATRVLDVRVTPDIGVDGDDILRVSIIVPDDDFDRIDGDQFVETILAIGEQLDRLGDHRFAVVTYITSSELAARGDDQP